MKILKIIMWMLFGPFVLLVTLPPKMFKQAVKDAEGDKIWFGMLVLGSVACMTASICTYIIIPICSWNDYFNAVFMSLFTGAVAGMAPFIIVFGTVVLFVGIPIMIWQGIKAWITWAKDKSYGEV